VNPKKWAVLALAAVLLILYNGSQPDLIAMRTSTATVPGTKKSERYGPSLAWLDRLRAGEKNDKQYVKLDFRVLSSMMLAGLASGFKSQVANLLWMKSDEYWHKGLLTRQIPIMEAVVTLDPQFVDAWSTAGWHWAYNIYADIELNPKGRTPREIRRDQQHAIDVGLDYLKRGAIMNPETYRLWFEHGWTRANKDGLYDEETIRLFRTARAQKDARTVEIGNRKMEGVDLIGRTIGHIYEGTPDIDEALAHYGGDMLKATPQEQALLRAAGEYWGRYSSRYTDIVDMYRNGDATIKGEIKKLVPDVKRMVAAQAMREKMQVREPQSTGAYVSIAARYLPAWNLMKQGKTQQAIDTIIGVMNADPRYHLQGLPVLAKVLELRGDAPEVIQKELQDARQYEKDSSQDIGLHQLAKLYEKTGDNKLAYETWYRARERSSLDFYARRNAQLLEDKFGFKPPQEIIDAIKKSRRGGAPNAAPPPPPNVPQYQHEAHGQA
jgi:tetratricopeptide (TPR) repeat protein